LLSKFGEGIGMYGEEVAWSVLRFEFTAEPEDRGEEFVRWGMAVGSDESLRGDGFIGEQSGVEGESVVGELVGVVGVVVVLGIVYVIVGILSLSCGDVGVERSLK
jgi:hypothetical protein